MVDDVKQQLSLTMDELTANIETNDSGNLIMAERLSDPRFNQPYSGIYWRAATQDQIIRSRSLWDKDLTIKRSPIHTSIKGPEKEKLIYIEQDIYLPELNDPVTITIGIDEDPLESTLTELTGQVWLILMLLFVGVLMLIGIQVSWSLLPLSKMQRELVMLRNGEQQGLSDNYPKEVSPLVSDLNALLFHYQELLERARNHAGNLSHALKTPLAVLKSSPLATDADANEQLDRINVMIEHQLKRAATGGTDTWKKQTPIKPVVDSILNAMKKVYRDKDIHFIANVSNKSYFLGDKTDLMELIGNIIDNACKACDAIVQIEVIEKQNTSMHMLSIKISDDGPGIPEESIKLLTQRGARLDTYEKGHGVGMAIVNDLVQSYQGMLKISDSDLGGALFNVEFNYKQN